MSMLQSLRNRNKKKAHIIFIRYFYAMVCFSGFTYHIHMDRSKDVISSSELYSFHALIIVICIDATTILKCVVQLDDIKNPW